MNILVIDEEFPHPLNTGKRLRSFNLTRVLAQHNSVTYLAYGDDQSESAAFLREHDIDTLAVRPPDRKKSGPMFYLRLLANLLSPLPYIVTSHYTNYYQDRLNREIAGGTYDIVICEWTPYASFLRSLTGVKSIIVAHNIESFIWARYVENEPNYPKRVYTAIQRDKVRRFEQTCFHWANGATAVSQIEADQISRFGVKFPVEVVDNGVDLEYFQPQKVSIDPDELVFTGSMDWRPNQDAVTYFVEEVLPLIRETRPRMKFTAVGRKPPEKIVKLGAHEGVTITGTVDDVRPYIARAGLYVVPLRVGGGSRLKILEAMAMRKPIVSTSIGAEGLHATPGVHISIADGAKQLSDAILSALNDPGLCETLAGEGRQLVQQQYSWPQLGLKLHQYLQKVVAG